MGGFRELLRALDACGAAAYFGGMFEIGPGRALARQLAAIFTPAAPSANRASAGPPDWEALLAALVATAPDAAMPLQFQAATQAASAPTQVAIVPSQARSVLAQAERMPPQSQVASEDATKPPSLFPSWGRRATDDPTADGVRAGRRETDKVVVAKDATLRIDTARLDQVLNLSGEIGLAKNQLNCLRTDILSGKTDAHTLRKLDEAISHLDLLVGDLQNAVMKTRMQPVGRLFQKYPRLVRDLARSLGKEVELHLSGEETELDRSMIEELSDPLVHLVRNAIDHGLETPAERRAAGKPEKGSLVLAASQAGDHIVIEIADDGRGIRTEMLRRKAIEKGLSEAEAVHAMDDRQALQLIFLPGFSTKEQISSVSGRGVGMDVVKTNIQKLNGRIDITSKPGAGTSISISLPLTLAILPVLVVRLGEQPFALPLSIVREILQLDPGKIQSVGGNATVVIRDEVLPVHSLASMLGFPIETAPAYGVLLQTAAATVVLAVDGFIGRDDVVIKALEGIKPRGIAGATLSGEGSVVLVLDMESLLQDAPAEQRRRVLALAA
jgi:two-component system chemotaxis sensor kinase CheA